MYTKTSDPIHCAAHATDDYIAQLATLLFKQADPTIYIYYEYSNEVSSFIELPHYSAVDSLNDPTCSGLELAI